MRNCEEFLKMLDTTESGLKPPEAFLEHAAGCKTCSFAMNLATLLESAPEWTPQERMAMDRRLELKAKARAGIQFRKDLADFVTDSFVTALLLCVAVFSSIIGLPPFLRRVIPASVMESAAPVFRSVAEPLHQFWSPFVHFLGKPESVVLVAVMLLMVFFTASLSSRMLSTARTG